MSSCVGVLDNKAPEKNKSGLPKKIGEYINAWSINGKFNGSVFIAKGDSILYNNSFGFAHREFNVANSDSTKFLIGSITKPFTAYGILLLEKQGKLSVDDKLSQYLPDFPNAERISIKQLLTHRSGITDYHQFQDWEKNGMLNPSPQSTLSTLLSNPSIFEPGERFSYTNSGYIILGLIIEQVSGTSFSQFIQSEIAKPLGLRNTGVASNIHLIKNLASGYRTTPRETIKPAYIDYNQPYASGNMYSTPYDLWMFTKAVVQSKFLSQEKTSEIFKIEKYYGYGWGIRDFNGVKAYGHYGAMNGFVGAITYIPDGEYFICFLTNDDNTPEYSIAEDLVKIINGENVSLQKMTELVALTESMKSKVIGDYLVKKGDTLSVFELDNKLYMHETGQIKHELFPIDSLEFELTLFEYKVAFSEPIDMYSDTLKFVGKSNLNANRITVPNNVYKK
jgi:CubicO group peptidase (beta-lactamase class C family)